ncbi:MAG: helix-turn-helix transcriptional regulator [Saccharofermentanales bacterium]|jgi:DNA-binding Xre family transcriptional regulator
MDLYDIIVEINFTIMEFENSGGAIVRFVYNGLWKKLIDKNLNKKELQERVDISPTTVAKMGRGEAVSLKILAKIAIELDTDIGDLVSLDKGELTNE